MKIAVSVSTDLEDDVIFSSRIFENSSGDWAVLAASSIASRRNLIKAAFFHSMS